MKEIGLFITIVSLISWLILASGKAGAQQIAKNILNNSFNQMRISTLPDFENFFLANAGVYVHRYIFTLQGKLAFKIWVFGGSLCFVILILSIINYGVFDLLSILSFVVCFLKIFTGVEAYYSYNLTEDVLGEQLLTRYQKRVGHIIPEYIKSMIPYYHEAANEITISYKKFDEFEQNQ